MSPTKPRLSILLLAWPLILSVNYAETELIRLKNQHLEVWVDPNRGRIVHLSRPGQDNLLWINPEPDKFREKRGWNQWGGERVLFSPQSLWPQIYGVQRNPDPVANDQPWHLVESGPDSVRLRSAFSPELGVYGERLIQLEKNRPVLHQTFRLNRQKPSPFPVHIWTLTHLPVSGTAWMSIAEDTVHSPSEPIHNFFRDPKHVDGLLTFYPEEALVAIHTQIERVFKIGTFGDWIAWENDGILLWILTDWQRGQPYIDQSNLQVFILPGTNNFMELETQSATSFPSPGETVEFTIRTGLAEWHQYRDHSQSASAQERLRTKERAIKGPAQPR